MNCFLPVLYIYTVSNNDRSLDHLYESIETHLNRISIYERTDNHTEIQNNKPHTHFAGLHITENTD